MKNSSVAIMTGANRSAAYLTSSAASSSEPLAFRYRISPCNQVAAGATAGLLDVKPTKDFRLEEIHEAHRVMEANEARGKMVVVND
jgi:NADPH:quinone reductase